MDRKKIVLVARDAAPSNCFIKLEPILKERGLEVALMVGKGKPLDKSPIEVNEAVLEANAVVLGMSSSPEFAQPEIMAGQVAKNALIPYGFYGDHPRCWAQAREGAWFHNLSSDAAFYFGITQKDADEAYKVFPNARLIGTGNPIREEMAFARFTREEVREKLGIAPEEKLVLAPGRKIAALNMAVWVITIEALSLLAGENRFHLILTVHPGDRTPYAADAATQKKMDFYNELILLSPVPTRIADILTTSDLIPGADVIIDFGSSIGVEGAYHNIPVVSLGFEILFRYLERSTGIRTLETVADGLSELVVADASKLAETIKRLLTPEGFAPMKARQQEICPKPAERGAALRKIADAIVQIA